MKAVRSVEIPLPAGARATEEERELIEAAVRAIVELHYSSGAECRECVRALEADGWKVRMELGWRAVASRGHDYEEASGRTRAEALDSLRRLTGLDSCDGCP